MTHEDVTEFFSSLELLLSLVEFSFDVMFVLLISFLLVGDAFLADDTPLQGHLLLLVVKEIAKFVQMFSRPIIPLLPLARMFELAAVFLATLCLSALPPPIQPMMLGLQVLNLVP